MKLKPSIESHRRYSKRVLMIVAIIPIISLVMICNNFYAEVTNINETYYSNIAELKARKLDIIDYIIDEKIEQALVQNKYVETQIIKQLDSAYPPSGDRAQLKADLESRTDSSEALHIFDKAIQSDTNMLQNLDSKYYEESLFICDRKGIIDDTGYVNPAVTSRDWESEIQYKKNKDLARNAVNLLLSKSDDIIFWDADDNIPKYVVDTKENVLVPDRNSLRQMVDQSGAMVLRNYNLLIPTYITPNGDIFGVPDTDEHGLPSNNNKLIIVREINMYNIVKPYITDISNYDYLINQYKSNVKAVIHAKISFCLFISTIFIVAFALILAVINGYAVKSTNRGDNNDP